VTTHLSPISQASMNGDLGLDYVFAQQEILEQLVDKLSVLGLITLYGDVGASGTTVLRITNWTGAGFAVPFDTMDSETAPIIPKSIETDFDSLSIARLGLGHEETWQQEIINREPGVSLDALVAKVPESLMLTFRQKMTVVGAGFADATGDGAAQWSFDDELDLATAFLEQDGTFAAPNTMRHREQFTDLRTALRGEPAYNTPEIQNAINSVRPGGGAFDFLGFSNFASNDVTEATGAHQGFAWTPGAIGWVVGNSMPVKVRNPSTAMYIPQFGLVIQESADSKVATALYNANAWVGFGALTKKVFPQRRIISKVH